MKKYSTEEVIKLSEELAKKPDCIRDFSIARELQDMYYLGVNDGIDRLAKKLKIGGQRK